MRSINQVQVFINNSIYSLNGRQICIALNKESSIPDSEKEFLECEKQCMSCMLKKDDHYPLYDTWTDEHYIYLKDRAKSVTHDKLIAKYNQILFNGDPKHRRQEQAQAAINAYIRIIESDKYEVWPDDGYSEWTYINMLNNLIGLSVRIKNYKESDIKALVRDLLTVKFSTDKDFQYSLIHSLLDFPKMFKAPDLDGMEDILEEIVQNHWKGQDFFSTSHIIETGLRVAAKRKTDVKRWYEMLGKNYEFFAAYRADDPTGIVPLKMTHKAMVAYQNAGNTVKVDELGARYPALADKLKLTSVKISIFKGKEKEMGEKLNEQVQTMLDAGAENIYYYLKRQIVLPDEELLIHIQKNAGNVFMPLDLLGLYTFTEFDLNKNIKAQPETEEEIKQDRLRQGYIWHEKATLAPFLDLLFYRGIKEKVLTAENLIDILAVSWIGAELVDTDSGGDKNEYNWLELLRPSIQIFFKEMEMAIHTDGYRPELIPAIDSLVLKCEGMLRDLAWAVDDNTKKPTRSGGIHEKSLEELLTLPKLKDSIDPTDLLFFRYVYTSFGLNLRNNIGHGFFRAYHYSPHYGYLIILSILRFAKYEVNPKESS